MVLHNGTYQHTAFPVYPLYLYTYPGGGSWGCSRYISPSNFGTIEGGVPFYYGGGAYDSYHTLSSSQYSKGLYMGSSVGGIFSYVAYGAISSANSPPFTTVHNFDVLGSSIGLISDGQWDDWAGEGVLLLGNYCEPLIHNDFEHLEIYMTASADYFIGRNWNVGIRIQNKFEPAIQVQFYPTGSPFYFQKEHSYLWKNGLMVKPCVDEVSTLNNALLDSTMNDITFSKSVTTAESTVTLSATVEFIKRSCDLDLFGIKLLTLEDRDLIESDGYLTVDGWKALAGPTLATALTMDPFYFYGVAAYMMDPIEDLRIYGSLTYEILTFPAYPNQFKTTTQNPSIYDAGNGDYSLRNDNLIMLMNSPTS